jgi:hypothetical protein
MTYPLSVQKYQITSLTDRLEDFGTGNFGQLGVAQSDTEWGLNISGPVLRNYQNALIDSTVSIPHNVLSYYHRQFHCSTFDEHLGLDCKIDYTNGYKGIMPEADTIWVEYTKREENVLDNSFEGLHLGFPGSYFS